MKLIVNRYDNLQAKVKRIRNKVDRRQTKDDNTIKKLQTKILNIKYKREVYINEKGNKLTDLQSLINNEQARILKDSIVEEYNNVTNQTPNKTKK